jgi:hypothetical protein
MYSRTIFGKKYYKLSESGLKNYLIDEIGLVYNIKRDIIQIPTYRGVFKITLWNTRKKKNECFKTSRLILDSKGVLGLYEQGYSIKYYNGNPMDCTITNLRIVKHYRSVVGCKIRFTITSGRVFHFNNFAEFKRIYEGMSLAKFHYMFKRKSLNGSKLEFLPKGSTEWIVKV